MAEQSGRLGGKKCEDCEKLSKLENFARGVKARIAGVYDCDNCEVTKSQPIWENENIIELYATLPNRFEGMTGAKYVTASDIKFVLELFDVPEELWLNYYLRLKFFCDEMVRVHTTKANKEMQLKAGAEKWKRETLDKLRKTGPKEIEH